MMTDSEADQEVLGDLVLAVLAVNGWSIERVFALREGLAAQGVLALDSLATLDPDAVAGRLHKGGYQRGSLNDLLAGRLVGLARAVTGTVRISLFDALRSRDVGALEAVLLPLKGVGPVVFRQFLILRGLE
jgi:hypothetical protein